MTKIELPSDDSEPAQLVPWLTDVCRRLAPCAFGDEPIYILLASQLPETLRLRENILGLVAPGISITYQDYISNWQGPGPAMLINDHLAISQEPALPVWEQLLSVVLHELAHIIESGADHYAAADVDLYRQATPALYAEVFRSPRPEPSPLRPSYHGHEWQFIRLCCHLSHRFQAQSGYRIPPQSLCQASGYGLSMTQLYVNALQREPANCPTLPFNKITATKPPAPFKNLWQQDVLRAIDTFIDKEPEDVNVA